MKTYIVIITFRVGGDATHQYEAANAVEAFKKAIDSLMNNADVLNISLKNVE